MSRIGKKAIDVPSGVKIAVNPSQRSINVEGKQGKLSFSWRPEVAVNYDESANKVTCAVDEASMGDKATRALWGTTRSRIANMVTGVTEGYMKKLEIVGVGWNAKPQGKDIQLNIGYCHPVVMTPPDGVEYKIEGQIITITGADKQAVGQFAANIRAQRKPEPYNGKGIKYLDEIIIRKQGKVFGS